MSRWTKYEQLCRFLPFYSIPGISKADDEKRRKLFFSTPPCVLLYPNGQNGIQNNGPVACNLMAAFLFE